MTQILLSIPTDEVKFFSILAKKMGWVVESKDNLIDRFINSCQDSEDISEYDIQKEVNAVRYKK